MILITIHKITNNFLYLNNVGCNKQKKAPFITL